MYVTFTNSENSFLNVESPPVSGNMPTLARIINTLWTWIMQYEGDSIFKTYWPNT